MIIWSRWGFLSFLGATIFACAAGVNALLAFFVYPRLDKPRQLTFTRPLAQPVSAPERRRADPRGAGGDRS